MKIDLHLHTTASRDGVHSPKTIVRKAKERKLDGVAITDHDSVSGWREAVRAGKEFGVLVIKGEEIAVLKNDCLAAHVLGLFLNEKIRARTMPEVADEIHEQGGIAAIAHPFDRLRGRYEDLQKFLDYFDAVEVFNSHCLFDRDNQIAREFAEKNKKPKIGGSDSHSKYEVGFGYTEAKAGDLDEFRKAILKGKTRVYGRKTRLLFHAFPVLSKRGFYPFKEK
jgi:predicted metal-dependent phosphoesterase TrpH